MGHSWDRFCLASTHIEQCCIIQEQAELADLENGKTSFHDSGSSLPSHPSPALIAADEVAAAKCWDIDAADIVICKHADGTEWLLNESESGKVHYT